MVSETINGLQALILLFFLCLTLGAFGAWLIARLGSSLRLIDSPNERSSHYRPIPKGGGIGILAAFVVSCWVLGIPAGFWLPVGVLSITGLVGDHLEIAPIPRLLIQFVMAFWFLMAATAAEDLSSGWIGKALLIVPLIIFVVGMTNFYNFMDGINGIAGLTGVVGFALMGTFAFFLVGKEQYGLLSFAMAFGCLGFLPFNLRREAKVFMGDVGSILLGAAFACLIVLIAKSWSDWLCLTGFLLPFYADELSTMAVRLKDREKLTQPHRRHIYQILANDKGIPHWQVSLGFGFFQRIVVLSVLLVNSHGIIAVLLTLCFYFAIFAVMTYYLRASVRRLSLS